MSKIITINPATEQTIEEFDVCTKEQVDQAVSDSKKALKIWKELGMQRADYLVSLADELRKNKATLARLITTEMGKPIKESLEEVEKCAWVMRYYAENGIKFLQTQYVTTDAKKSFVVLEPLGVIGSIMPWNFPLWQALRFAAPSLMSGNTVVLKPSSVAPRCGIAIEDSFRNSGFPENVFQTVVGDLTTAELLLDANIDGVSFTGSVNVGAKVGQKALSRLKKCVLELGGSDPFIVCNDANIEKAATGALKGRFINCGQSCIASKRFFVVKDVAEEFIDKFVKKTEKLKVGDPLDEDTDIGPLVNKSALETARDQVYDAIAKGANLLTGGERIERKGFFFPPTIISKVTKEMKVMQEETFSPVAPITIVDNEDEAVKLANSSRFGLGASVWTEDLIKAERMTTMLENGMICVNNVVVSDPRLPFGGIKDSGIGRELSSYGMLEFTNIKSVRFYEELIVKHYVE